MFDAELFGDEMAVMVRGFVERATAPLIEANAALTAENKALAERLAAVEAREPGVTEARATELIGERLAALPAPEAGEPGADCDMEAVKAHIEAAVAETVATLAPPAAGKDCDMEAVAEMVRETVWKAVEALPMPKDGIGLANALKDQHGHLMLVMTDGSTKDLGKIDGERGAPGFSLDHFEAEQIDERIIRFVLRDAEQEAACEFKFPVTIYRDIWNAERTYDEGDAVTWAGSLWIAQRDAPGKPDTQDCGWRLAVKRGRDGKDAK